jgi:hypothetical protein
LAASKKESTSPVSKPCRMRWQRILRSERDEIVPHAPRSTSESDPGYGFDAKKYPALAEAADVWSEISESRLKRWRLRRRSMK